MSNLYGKNYISSYNFKEMLDILEGKVSYFPDPYNLQERRKYISLQHFLIKYMEENGKTKVVKDLLKKYYDDFAYNPSLFVDSPLIRNGFLDRFIPITMKNKIKDFREKYYNPKDIEIILRKLMNNYILSEIEKNRLYAFLINKITNNNPKYNDIADECAKRIVHSNKNPKYMNNMEFKFYCTYVAKRAGSNQVLPTVHIMDDEDERLGGFEQNNIIYINKRHTDQISKLTKVVCHETRHAVQEKDSRNKTNRTAFEMARHLLFTKYLKTEDYDVYHDNYRYTDIEIDAENYGYYYSKVLLLTLGRGDLNDKLREEQNSKHKQRQMYEFMIDMGKHAKSTDSFVVQYMDYIIKTHPEELDKFKVLKTFYNDDGSRKSLATLLTNRANQGIDDRGLYDNYMNYEIAKDRLFELDLEHTTKDVYTKIFKAIGSIYRDKALLFKDYCDDKNYKNSNENQIRTTTLYQLSLLYNMLNFIDQKMDYVLSCKEEKVITNRSFIYDFIYDLRDFNLNNIDNEVIKNDPIIRERVSKLLDKHKSIVKKFNEQLIKDRTADLTIEQRHAMIVTPEGVNMQLQDYLYYDLLPRLDGHSEVEINGQKVYASNVIKGCLQQIQGYSDTDLMRR